MREALKRYWADEGQGVPEYGMILGGVMVVAVLLVLFFRPSILELFGQVETKIEAGIQQMNQ